MPENIFAYLDGGERPSSYFQMEELAPAYWKQTLQNEDTQQRLLAANIFRQAYLGLLDSHSPSK